MKQRRKNRRKRRRTRKNRGAVRLETNQRATEPAGSGEDESAQPQPKRRASALTHAIRATGILPIVVLIGILTTHHLYSDQIPPWFLPIIEKQVAALTLCAGHAAIISLWINRETQHGWSTFALLVAASATAGAGYRSIGENTAGHFLVLLLFLLFFPAVWAEPISRGVSRLFRFLRTKKGMFTVTLVLWVLLVIYNQSENEDYIRYWLLYPLGILLGFFVSASLLSLILRLAFRYLPVAYSWVQGRLSYAYRRLFRKEPRK